MFILDCDIASIFAKIGRIDQKINHRGRGGSQRIVIFLCVPLRSLRFSESSQKIIKSLGGGGCGVHSERTEMRYS